MTSYLEETSKLKDYDNNLKTALIKMYLIFKIVENNNDLIKVANGG